MVERSYPKHRQKIEYTFTSPKVDFDQILLRSSSLIGTKPITPTEKLFLLGHVCEHIFPAQIDQLRKDFGVAKKIWNDFLTNPQATEKLQPIYTGVLKNLETEGLIEIQNVSLALTKTRKSILDALISFQQSNPGKKVNLQNIADLTNCSRENVSKTYKYLAGKVDLPPKKSYQLKKRT